jgi:hypothetical protein
MARRNQGFLEAGAEMAAYKDCGAGRRFDELVVALPPSRLGLLEQDASRGPSGLFLKPMASSEQGRGAGHSNA